MYAIEFTRQAAKDIRKLNDPTLSRILKGISELEEEPRPEGCKKLKHSDDLWRIRIGVYRVVYAIADEVEIVSILRVKHRKDVYDGL